MKAFVKYAISLHALPPVKNKTLLIPLTIHPSVTYPTGWQIWNLMWPVSQIVCTPYNVVSPTLLVDDVAGAQASKW